MKRLFLLVIAAISAVTAVFSQRFSDGTFTYQVIGYDEVEVTYKDMNATAYYNQESKYSITTANIPQSVYYQGKSYKVTTIGKGAFYLCSLKELTLPPTIKYIKESAFSLNSIGSLQLPSGLLELGEEAFSYNNFTSVDIPASVFSIGKEIFKGCKNLQKINVNKQNTMYCDVDGVLYTKNMSQLISYPQGCRNEVFTVPTGVNELLDYSCMKAYFSKIILPNTVTKIGNGCFRWCERLTEIVIPMTVRSIGCATFGECTSLRNVYLPTGIEMRYKNPSETCYPFKEAKSVNLIYKNADFYASYNPYQNNAGSQQTAQANQSNQNNYGSSAQQVPTARNITGKKVNAYSSKGRIYDGTLYYKTTSGNEMEVTFLEDEMHKNYTITSVNIPAQVVYNGQTYTVTAIGESAFEWCENLQTITIPSTVKELKSFSLSRCKKLSNLTLSEGLEIINSYAISNTDELYSITLPRSLKQIGNYAFEYSKLSEIYLHENVNKIGDNPWGGCKNFKKITVAESNPYLCDIDGVLYNKDLTKLIAFPTNKATTYSIPGTVTTIAGKAFIHAIIQSVVIPNGVSKIDGMAFYRCENLREVTLPPSLNNLSCYTFSYCLSLTNVYIPSNCKIKGSKGETCYSFDNSPLVNIVYKNESYFNTYYANNPAPTVRPRTSSAYTNNQNNSSANSSAGTTVNNTPAPVAPNKKISPAILSMVEGSLRFVDAGKNNAIDVGETCHIQFKVKNIGQGNGNNCTVKVLTSGDNSGIQVRNQTINNFMPNQTLDIDIPIVANMQAVDGNVTFKIEVTEPNGFGTDPVEMTVATKAFNAPHLQIVDYAVTGGSGGQLVKKLPFNLQLMLQNTKYGKAENIDVQLVLPEGVFIMDGEEDTKIKQLDGGRAQSLDYQLIVSNNFAGTRIPIQVKLKERYGRYAENKNIDLELNQTLSSTRLTVQAVEQQRKPEIQIATIGSAVDKNIPVSQQKQEHTFAVIIANENYQQVAKVPFAHNDGNTFRLYCERTLGIPAQNIHYKADATLGHIRQEVNWLSGVISAYKGKARIIFYYAGHGVPDERSRSAYLLPVDGSGSDILTAYKLDDLYLKLGSMPSEAVTVILDACFSGSKREGDMLASARGVAIKAKAGQPQGNMVVFSAATGDETAYPNNREGHGMFTYYLLKKLQETKGEVTYEELSSYVKEKVSQQSIVENGKSQTPTINASLQAENWQEWKLK